MTQEHSKAWLEKDTDFCKGLISEINDAEIPGFFIDCANRPNTTGFRWVCGNTTSKYFLSSKEALIDFLRVAASKF
jgi:hypothetical protein